LYHAFSLGHKGFYGSVDCKWFNLDVGQTVNCASKDFGATVTRVANDLTPRPGESSNRYQYSVTLDWIPSVASGSTINVVSWPGGGPQTVTGYNRGSALDATFSSPTLYTTILAYSSDFDHPIAVVYGSNQIPDCQWNLDVGETKTCRAYETVSVTRIEDDTSLASPGRNADVGGRRYQYNVTITSTT
jgi:uncharacterized protein YodC (DUF2158 family)